MKAAAAMFGALAIAACTAQPPADARQPDSAVDAELDALEQQWAALAMHRDDALLDRIIASDFSGQSDDGTVRNKAQEMAYWASQPGTFSAATPAQMTFHHYGVTVVGQGRQTLTPASGGPPLRIVWTDTWIRRDGRWQAVSSQDAVLSAPDAGDDMG